MQRKIEFVIVFLLTVVLAGCFKISGEVTVMGTDQPIAGVEISIEGSGLTETVLSDTEGNFSFTKVPSGTYVINAAMPGYTIMPESQTIQGILGNKRVDFSGADADKVWKKEVDGLTFIRLEGSPYEMGFQHGMLMKDRAKDFEAKAMEYLASYMGYDNLPEIVLDVLVSQAVQPWLDSGVISSDYIEEMQGISDATGISYDKIVLSNLIWELKETMHCSEFAAFDSATESGTLYHGYNMDTDAGFAELYSEFSMLVFYHPQDKKSFTAGAFIGSVGVYSGINEEQLSVAWDNTRLKSEYDVTNKGYFEPFVFTLRKSLEEASDIDEMANIIKNPYRPLGDITIIASGKEKRAVALEIFDESPAPEDQHDVVREATNNVIYSANQFQSEMAIYDLNGYNERVDAYEQLLLDPGTLHGLISVENSINEILSVAPICAGPRNELSILYSPEEMSLWISTLANPACGVANTFIGFDIINEEPLDEEYWINYDLN